jgi:hypothetical protein
VRQAELDWGEVGDQGDGGNGGGGSVGGSLAHLEDKTRLMSALDSINQRFGKGTMKMASAGLEGDRRAWSMKQERRTPAYTTCWADIPVARA